MFIKKTFLLILIGFMLGLSFNIFALELSWWRPGNHQSSQENNKTSEVQIWCELRTQRTGWETYCNWTGKNWKLTCAGMERFFGTRIEPTEGGMYGCEDY